jgi:hypothetical protein
LVFWIKSYAEGLSYMTKQFLDVLKCKSDSALSEKKKLRKIVLVNRGSTHYRW